MKKAPRLPHLSLIAIFALLALLAFPVLASAAAKPGSGEHPQPPVETKTGALEQLPGRLGCLADGPAARSLCGKARALKGPGPFMGSRAIAISPDGRSVYVASGGSDAIAVFSRNPATGALTQLPGRRGCVAAPVAAKGKGTASCGIAVGLIGPNSVAVSPDGKDVYATSREGASVTTFHRNRKSGALKQLPPSASGCVSGLPIPTCTAGRALKGPDVVVVSPDGKNVYVGDFFGNAVVSFARAEGSGALTQLAGAEGCIADGAVEGCATGTELGSVEGLAVSPDGSAVYAAAAVSNAVDVLYRDPATGALSQSTSGSGCITETLTAGCAQGYQLAGVNALATDTKSGDVYATSLFSNSLTTFHPATPSVGLVQPARPSSEKTPEGIGSPTGCAVFLRAPGCSFVAAMKAPEGVALSPIADNVYVAAYETGAIDVFDRDPETGVVSQKPGEHGCNAPRTTPVCARGRALNGVSSVVVSPDGRNVYSTAQKTNAIDIFRRIR